MGLINTVQNYCFPKILVKTFLEISLIMTIMWKRFDFYQSLIINAYQLFIYT